VVVMKRAWKDTVQARWRGLRRSSCRWLRRQTAWQSEAWKCHIFTSGRPSTRYLVLGCMVLYLCHTAEHIGSLVQAVVGPCRRSGESFRASSPSMFSKAEARNTAPLATRPAPRHRLHATAASRPPSTPSVTRRQSCCGSWDQCSDAPVPCRQPWQREVLSPSSPRPWLTPTKLPQSLPIASAGA
jgi:hypothetical protein